MKRRDFLQASAGTLAATAMFTQSAKADVKGEFDISVAAWSWHKMFFSGEIKMIDQIGLAKKAGATGVEFVNQFFASPMNNYLRNLNKRAADEGVKIVLIMVDGESSMNAPDMKTRNQAFIDHRKWVDIGAVLGCQSIRCNAGHFGRNSSAEDSMKYAAESFTKLSDYAMQYNMNIIIENHGGLSSDPNWLVGLMKMVDKSNFGTLPDFGNFYPKNDDGTFPPETDIYKNVDMMMPYAKAFSAKCYDFDADGNETVIDFGKMMEIAFKHNYHGFVGVEYEGGRLGELEGIEAGVKLLKRFQA